VIVHPFHGIFRLEVSLNHNLRISEGLCPFA
jgi:hypothetical protein